MTRFMYFYVSYYQSRDENAFELLEIGQTNIKQLLNYYIGKFS